MFIVFQTTFLDVGGLDVFNTITYPEVSFPYENIHSKIQFEINQHIWIGKELGIINCIIHDNLLIKIIIISIIEFWASNSLIYLLTKLLNFTTKFYCYNVTFFSIDVKILFWFKGKKSYASGWSRHTWLGHSVIRFFLLLSVDLLFLALVLASKIFSSSSVYTLQHLQSQICQCLTSHGKGGLGLRYQKYFH